MPDSVRFRWRQSLPTALIVAALAAVGYWGHSKEWKFASDKRAEKRANDSSPQRWIEPYPDSAFTQPCTEHSLPGCPHCNPRLAQLSQPPEFTNANREQIRQAMALRDRLFVRGRAFQPPGAIRFVTEDAVETAGIDITPAWTAPFTETITGPAEVGFQPAKSVHVSAKAPGIVWKSLRQIGDVVRAGEILALVESPEVGKAKTELQIAMLQVRLKDQSLRDLSAAPVQERQRKEAEAALKEAEVRLLASEQALRNFGFAPPLAELRKLSTDALSERLRSLDVPRDEAMGASTNLLPVRSPIEGIVLASHIVIGESADTAKELFQIVDPRSLRVTIHVPAADAKWIRLGQSMQFRADGSDAEFSGQISWVGVAADESTRTVPMWAEVANPAANVRFVRPLLHALIGGAGTLASGHEELRASTLGTASVVLREEPNAVLVPASAVESISNNAVVFVRDRGFLNEGSKKLFHVRTVTLGGPQGNNIEIIAGLLSGEVVAFKGVKPLADDIRNKQAAESNRTRRGS